MSFDVKAKVEELVGKVQKDPATLKDFQDDPIKTVEKLLGVDLPSRWWRGSRPSWPPPAWAASWKG